MNLHIKFQGVTYPSSFTFPIVLLPYYFTGDGPGPTKRPGRFQHGELVPIPKSMWFLWIVPRIDLLDQ